MQHALHISQVRYRPCRGGTLAVGEEVNGQSKSGHARRGPRTQRSRAPYGLPCATLLACPIGAGLRPAGSPKGERDGSEHNRLVGDSCPVPKVNGSGADAAARRTPPPVPRPRAAAVRPAQIPDPKRYIGAHFRYAFAWTSGIPISDLEDLVGDELRKVRYANRDGRPRSTTSTPALRSVPARHRVAADQVPAFGMTNCVVCEHPLWGKRSHAVTCSTKCRVYLSRLRRARGFLEKMVRYQNAG